MIGDIKMIDNKTVPTTPTAPETPKMRVQKELAELQDKIQKLNKYLYSEEIITANLKDEMIELLDMQLFAMQNYAAILQNRLAIWDDVPRQFRHRFAR